MIFFNDSVKSGFEEGFNLGLYPGNNPWKKLEYYTQVNGFNIGIVGGSDCVIFKFNL